LFYERLIAAPPNAPDFIASSRIRTRRDIHRAASRIEKKGRGRLRCVHLRQAARPPAREPVMLSADLRNGGGSLGISFQRSILRTCARQSPQHRSPPAQPSLRPRCCRSSGPEHHLVNVVGSVKMAMRCPAGTCAVEGTGTSIRGKLVCGPVSNRNGSLRSANAVRPHQLDGHRSRAIRQRHFFHHFAEVTSR